MGFFTKKPIVRPSAPLFRYRQGEPTLGVGTSNLFYEKETEDPVVSIYGAGTPHGNLSATEGGFITVAPHAEYNWLGEEAGNVVIQNPIDEQTLQALIAPPEGT